jgi:hypothetical protein
MAEKRENANKPLGGSDKSTAPHRGGDAVQNAEQWGGGSKGSKGPITPTDKHNPNSSAKS